MESHSNKVAKIVADIKAINARRNGERVRFEKDSVSHFVPNPFDDEKADIRIDFSPLNELLQIDKEALTATAEPGLSFSELTQATLTQGLMPVVVPELKGITIGGAVSGCSIESQSFRYGGFHDSCLEYEAVTGEGELITCSEQENPDVFHLLHGSYGTLARLTRITFKLMPAKPYVKMTYRRFDRFPEYWAELRALCESAEFPFIDGIIHAKDCFVLCLGEMVENPPYVSDYTWLDIFYKSTRSRTEDYLSIYDYFFRYDTECHWLTRTLPLMESKPVRFALGKWLLGSTNLITWSKRLKRVLRLKKRPEVVVDVFIPGRRFEEFYNWYEADFDFYPLWIVPYRMPAIYPWVSDEHAARMNDTFLIDAAVYGKANTRKSVDYSELMERKVFEFDGVKTLISRNHYSPETFWSIYSRPRIQTMKQRLDPGNLFGDLYEKFSPEKYG